MLKSMKQGGDGGGYQWMAMDPAFLDRGLRLEQMDRHMSMALSCSVGHSGCSLSTSSPTTMSTGRRRGLPAVDGRGVGLRRRRAHPHQPGPVHAQRREGLRAARLDLRARRQGHLHLPWAGVRAVARRPALRPILGAHRRGGRSRLLPHQRSNARLQVQPIADVGQDQHPTFYTQSAWQWRGPMANSRPWRRSRR